MHLPWLLLTHLACRPHPTLPPAPLQATRRWLNTS